MVNSPGSGPDQPPGSRHDEDLGNPVWTRACSPPPPGNPVSPAHTLRQRLNYLQKTAPNCGIGLRLQGWRKPSIPPHSGTGAHRKAPSISSNLPYSTQRMVGTLVTLLPDTSFSVACRKRLTETLGPGEVFITVSIVHGAESKVWG